VTGLDGPDALGSGLKRGTTELLEKPGTTLWPAGFKWSAQTKG